MLGFDRCAVRVRVIKAYGFAGGSRGIFVLKNWNYKTHRHFYLEDFSQSPGPSSCVRGETQWLLFVKTVENLPYLTGDF